MSQKKRILLAVGIVLILSGAMLAIDHYRGQRLAAELDASLEPGDIPIYWDGLLKAAFSPKDIENLPPASFVDAEKGKTQEGWMLKDVLLVYFPERQFRDDTAIKVISTSRNKSADLEWQEVANPDNMVMFDLSGRGTLKLVSLLERLDERDEWVQDVDRIEVSSK